MVEERKKDILKHKFSGRKYPMYEYVIAFPCACAFLIISGICFGEWLNSYNAIDGLIAIPLGTIGYITLAMLLE